MSQWGQQNWGQQGGRAVPPQRWAAAQPQWSASAQQWGAPRQQWAPPVAQQPWGTQAQTYRPQQQVSRGRGAASAIRVILFVLGAIVAGIVLVGLFSETDDLPTVEAPPAEYQNESYQVPAPDLSPPDLPVPDTYEEASEWLTDNAVYDQSVAEPVRCDAAPIDLTSASDAQLEAHFNELTGCLMRVFAPALESAGFEAVRPSVTVYSSPIQTKCGTMDTQNAAYCGGDQQVYYATDLPDIIPANLQRVDYVVESIIAHEFGHAIQARTGMLISESAWEGRSDESDALSLSRRLEVQADCFAGEFIDSVGYSVGVDEAGSQEISELFYAIGDDQLSGDPTIEGNHGHGDSRQLWFTRGTQNTSLGTCNTFVAAEDEVA
ncbi:hypothetical protein GCM10009785_08560 [Brooklawnia cerclae]|uniref:Neutral zinc metallopeptidase n=1 Tax=Brooklawnia cerclae TaxID=349934 RepID=A0ABX0SM88_9ACTN|nr:hypothetical protein [Brooklawnia cerclae]